jgi:hypothetical protein
VFCAELQPIWAHVDVPFRLARVVFLFLLSLSSVHVDGPFQPRHSCILFVLPNLGFICFLI